MTGCRTGIPQGYGQQQLDAVKLQHQRAARNMLLADPENVPALNAAMTDLRQRIKVLESELSSANKPISMDKMADDIINGAKPLFDVLLNGEGDVLKAVLSRLVVRVDLTFGDGEWGKRKIGW